MRFAFHELQVHGAAMKHYDELMASGSALLRYLDICRDHDVVFPDAALKELVVSCQRHLINAERSEIAFVPKHHLFVHLTMRTSYLCQNI